MHAAQTSPELVVGGVHVLPLLLHRAQPGQRGLLRLGHPRRLLLHRAQRVLPLLRRQGLRKSRGSMWRQSV